MKNRKVNTNILLLIVLLVAAALRFYKLTEVPPSLNWDEVSHGYNAYSILKTGKDEWGVSFPSIFKAYGDYKLPVYIYLTSLSVGLFGLNALAVRLPSVIAGVVTVIFTYLLVNEFFSYELQVTGLNKKNNAQQVTRNGIIGLIAALLVAIEPWSLFLSRGAFEANLAQAFIVVGVYFFVYALRYPERMEKVEGSHRDSHVASLLRMTKLLLSTIFLGLSVWTYNSARVFVPLLLISLILIYREELLSIWSKDRKAIAYCLVTIALFFLPMFYQLVTSSGQARYNKVAIINEGAVTEINESIRVSKYSLTLSRLIYNKGTYFAQRFIKNYFTHFSPKYLFFEGGSHYQFSVPSHGLLYLVNIIFLPVGIFYLLKERKKLHLILLGWFLLAPVASSLTRESPHVLRSITFLPTPMIVSAFGFVWFCDLFGKRKLEIRNWKLEIPLRKTFVLLYSVILFVASISYLKIYFSDYRSGYSWSWQYGYEQVVGYARGNYDKYDKIIVTKKYGEPHEFFLFYWPWDPESFQSDPNLVRFEQSDWYWVDRFDKFYFVNDWDIPSEEWESFVLESGGEFDCEDQKCLLVTGPDSYPKGWSKLKTVNFLDNKPVFEILHNN